MRFFLGQPLLADLTELLIGLAVLVMAILKQLFEANKQAGSKRAAQAPPPQQAARPKPAEAGQQADPLRNQVEEFLRRAGKDSQSAQRPPQQRPANEIELLIEESRRSLTDANRPNPKPQALKQDPKRAARRSVTPKRRVTLAERAAAREEVRVGNLPEQQPHLGRRIIDEDKQFDEQLKAKFDHAVGTLGATTPTGTAGAPTPQAQSPAAQIAAMLANPGSMQQAVILNEILNRPSDRW